MDEIRTPAGFIARTAAPADEPGVMKVVNEAVLADVDMHLYRDGDLADEWKGREADDLIVFETDGPTSQIAGFLSFEPSDNGFYFEGFVPPSYEGKGLGRAMVDEGERRAEALAAAKGTPVVVETNVGNELARLMFEERGWKTHEFDAAMFYDLTGELPEVIWPDGITLRPYVEGDDDLLMHDTMKEGFVPDWPASTDREKWVPGHRSASGYSPDLWFFAQRGDEVLGAIMCRETWHAEDSSGWIKNLSVLPSARRTGVGRALLFEAFRRFKERGRERAVLGVHLNNPTAAKDFYLRVGMTMCPHVSADLRKTFAP